MNSRPLLLDLFCCAGGASRGYERAGFEVVGVDIAYQPHYPYPMIVGDALQVLDELLYGSRALWLIHGNSHSLRLSDIAAIHASCPCQRWAGLVNCRPGVADTYPDLIEPTRTRLKLTGKPYVIENVMKAPLEPTVILCGTQFDRRFQLHRQFEANFDIPQRACRHGLKPFNPEASEGRKRMRAELGDGVSVWGAFIAEKGLADMPHNGNDKKIAREAISPFYTEYVGEHMLRALDATKIGEAA